MQAWTRAQTRERPGALVMSARESEVARGGCSRKPCPAGCPSLRQGSGGNRAAGWFKSCRAALALLLACKVASRPRPTGMPIACDRCRRRRRYLNALTDEGANVERQWRGTTPMVLQCSSAAPSVKKLSSMQARASGSHRAGWVFCLAGGVHLLLTASRQGGSRCLSAAGSSGCPRVDCNARRGRSNCVIHP